MANNELTYHICGSFPTDAQDHDIIIKNLSSFAEAIFLSGSKVLIRAVPKIEKSVLVDQVVFDVANRLISEKKMEGKQLIVIYESGTDSNLEISFECDEIHSPFSDRSEFYNEILEKSDAVIAIGGAAGVDRLLTLSEHLRIPIFAIPGAGGTADSFWKDLLTRCLQKSFLSDEQVLEIKRMIPINRTIDSYGGRTFTPLSRIAIALQENFRKNKSEKSEKSEIIDLQKSTFGDLIKISHRLTLKSWSIFLGFISIVFGLGVATCHLFKK